MWTKPLAASGGPDAGPGSPRALEPSSPRTPGAEALRGLSASTAASASAPAGARDSDGLCCVFRSALGVAERSRPCGVAE